MEKEKLDKLESGKAIWRPEKNLGSGIYLVCATLGGKTITKRVVYLK